VIGDTHEIGGSALVIPGARNPGKLTCDVRADELGRAARVAPRSHGHAKRDQTGLCATSANPRHDTGSRGLRFRDPGDIRSLGRRARECLSETVGV